MAKQKNDICTYKRLRVMTPQYDNIDIALIYCGCINVTEVLKATKILREIENTNLNLVREFSNKRIRQFIKNE